MRHAARAPRGAAGAPPGRLQVDRHGGHLALRSLRVQPGGHPHRAGSLAQQARGQGVGPARVPRLDTDRELGARNIKMALRRLRRFAREGAPEILDLDGTVRSTARNAGWLDLRMVPERHNAVKVLLFLDVGGTMDDHIQVVRGALLGGAHRVQEPRALLLPQLRVRIGVEGQPPPPGAHPDRGGDAQVRARLQAGAAWVTRR